MVAWRLLSSVTWHVIVAAGHVAVGHVAVYDMRLVTWWRFASQLVAWRLCLGLVGMSWPESGWAEGVGLG